MKILQIFTIIFLCFRVTYSQLFPHIIWLYWNSGFQNLGRFQRLCYLRTRQLHEGTNWNIRFVSDKTLPLWLNMSNFKRYQEGKVQIYNGFYLQTNSDLVRFFLLKQHGGVWLDVSILLKQNLNWLDDLLQNPRIIHRNIFKKPEVFIHHQHWTQLKQMTNIQINGYSYYPLFQIQSSFIAAVPESKYINDMIDEFQHLLRQRQPYYNEVRSDFNIPNQYSAYFVAFRACLIIQYRKYVQYQNALHQNKPISNLSDHFYNVLTLNRDLGMYHGSINEWRVRQFLLDTQGRFGDYQNYCMKFSRVPANFVVDILQNTQKKQQEYLKWIDRDGYSFGQQYISKQYEIWYKLKVHEDSAINKYLLSNKKQFALKFPNAQIIKKSQIPIFCRLITLKTFMWSYPIIFQWVELACMVIIFSQFLFQYYIAFFKASMVFFSDLKFLRYRIYTKIFILTVIYLQKDLIYSQYQLWKQYSPTAILVGVFQVMMTILLFKWFIDIDLKDNKKKNYWTQIILIVFFQYFFMYFNSVWKYEGQIYSYEILAQLNKKKLQEGVVHVIEIIILLIFGNISTFLKWFFGLSFLQKKLEREQQQQLYLSQSSMAKNYEIYNNSVNTIQNMTNNLDYLNDTQIISGNFGTQEEKIKL